jgi:release factor glutamine methyltransferase
VSGPAGVGKGAPARPGAPRSAPGLGSAPTLLELLRWTTGYFEERGIETPRLDAECLLAHALGVDRLRLYLDFDKPANASERAAYRELVRRRASERIPVAQLVGRREFWSLSLRVTPAVLVPRPETEVLVQAALDLLPERGAPARALDLGTGSGAIALALASERPGLEVSASDISPAALALARENAQALGLAGRVRWLEGSLFEPVAGERFDLVVSNPPYVAESQRAMLPPELAHEPEVALFAGPDGLAVLRPLVAGVSASLRPGGAVALEISPDQADLVTGWCRQAGLLDVSVRRDLSGNPRVLTGRGAS